VKLLPLALLLILATPALADDLPAWLEQTTSSERWEKDVVAKRRAEPDLANKLLAFARSAARPELAFKALELLGACEDRAELARDVRPLDERAASRIETRTDLLGRLDAALSRTSEEGVTTGDLAPVSSLALAAREAVALARDPLFEGRRRAVLVRLLPDLAPAADADPLAIAVEIVQGRERDGAKARVRALALLEESAPHDVLARSLADALDDSDPRVLERVFDAMAILAASPETNQPNTLDDPLSTFAARALEAGSSLERRTRAVEALGRTRIPAAVPFLESALQHATPIREDRVRAAALVALGRTGGRTAAQIVALLVELLVAGSNDSQERAIDGLGELPRLLVEEVIRPKLAESSDVACTRAAQAARALALTGLAPDLVKLARNNSASLQARAAAIRALEVTGDSRDAAQAVGLVLAKAREMPQMASLRRAAALALGSAPLRGEAARVALGNALQDDSSIVRLAVLRSLGEQGDERAKNPLLALALKTDVAPRERAQAIRSLDRLDLNDDDVARRVSAAIQEDPAPEVAMAGADFLARASREVAIPALLRLLESTEPSVRERAHGALLARSGFPTDSNPFHYDPAPNADRADALQKWREWWEVHRER
jgi:HEAT repeat protein